MSIIGTIVGYSAKGIGTGISAASFVPRKMGQGLVFVGTKMIEASDAIDSFGQGIAESGEIGLWGDKNVTAESYNAFAAANPDIAKQGADAVVKAMYYAANKKQETAKEVTVKPAEPVVVKPEPEVVKAEVVKAEVVKAEVVKAEQVVEESEEIPPHILAAQLC